jgi:hypothetical protein
MTRLNQGLLERMKSDMEVFDHERTARAKIEPLVKQISHAFYNVRFMRLGRTQPTRLHVSAEIHEQLLESLKARNPDATEIYFMRCPVIAIPNLNGFLWVDDELAIPNHNREG